MPQEEDSPAEKAPTFSEKSKKIFSKGVEVTKESSKMAIEFGKKFTEDGLAQAKVGVSNLNQKKDEFIARRDAKKLEDSVSDFRASPGTSVNERSSQMDLIQEQMKQIENDFPTVLNEYVPPKPPVFERKKWPTLFASSMLFLLSLLTLVHTIAPYSGLDSLELMAWFIQFLIPSWLSNSSHLLGIGEWPVILGIVTTLVLFVSSALTFADRSATRLLWWYYGGVLCLGQLVLTFYSETLFEWTIVFDFIRDFIRTILVVALAQSRTSLILEDDLDKNPTIFDFSGLLGEKGNMSNTSDELASFIEEGLSMDFRSEVAKPKPPRARAKFETYEVLLLCASFVLWPITIVMTMALDGGLSVWTEYSSGPVQVGAVWGMSLFTLLCLVRFDRSARGNGWYAKEKETYVGMMDLYSKAQAKHYEYVELRAAAEAQEILEKYPQLDSSKSVKSSRA